MKRLVIMLAIAMCFIIVSPSFADTCYTDCEICGKRIWYECSSDLTFSDGTISAMFFIEQETMAEKLSYHADVYVCKHCQKTFGASFKERMHNVFTRWLDDSKALSHQRINEMKKEKRLKAINDVKDEIEKLKEQLKKIEDCEK